MISLVTIVSMTITHLEDSVCEFSTAPEAKPKHLASGNLEINTTVSSGFGFVHHTTCSRCTEDDTHFTCFHHQIVRKCIRWQHLKVSGWASDIKLQALNVSDKTQHDKVWGFQPAANLTLQADMWDVEMLADMTSILHSNEPEKRSKVCCQLPWRWIQSWVPERHWYCNWYCVVPFSNDIDIAINLCSKVLHAHRVQSSPVGESVLTSHGCIPEFQRWPKSFEEL